VNLATIALCVASQQVFILVVYFVMTQSGNLWIQPRIIRRYVTYPAEKRG